MVKEEGLEKHICASIAVAIYLPRAIVWPYKTQKSMENIQTKYNKKQIASNITWRQIEAVKWFQAKLMINHRARSNVKTYNTQQSIEG